MKKLLCVALVVLALFSLVGCNYNVVDTTYKFDYAILNLPNGEIVEGEIDNWTDFEDGDQIQVKIDGTTYLLHSTDAVLIKY